MRVSLSWGTTIINRIWYIWIPVPQGGLNLGLEQIRWIKSVIYQKNVGGWLVVIRFKLIMPLSIFKVREFCILILNVMFVVFIVSHHSVSGLLIFYQFSPPLLDVILHFWNIIGRHFKLSTYLQWGRFLDDSTPVWGPLLHSNCRFLLNFPPLPIIFYFIFIF